jgi:hypothetical protein
VVIKGTLHQEKQPEQRILTFSAVALYFSPDLHDLWQVATFPPGSASQYLV